MCCFELHLSLSESYSVTYTPNTTPAYVSTGNEGPAGTYFFHLEGEAYGLGPLYKGLDTFQATDGGVSSGARYEGSNVKDASNGAPYCKSVLPSTRPKYVRASSDEPALSWGHQNASGYSFGGGFPSSSTLCKAWDAWQGTNNDEYPDPFRGVLAQPAQPPYLYGTELSFLKRLFKREDASFQCTEHETGTTITDPQQGGHTIDAFTVLDASIEFFSPDDLKRRQHELKRMLNDRISFDTVALHQVEKYFDPSSPTGVKGHPPANDCRSM